MDLRLGMNEKGKIMSKVLCTNCKQGAVLRKDSELYKTTRKRRRIMYVKLVLRSPGFTRVTL